MVFGMLPLALGIGQGAEMRAPMGRAVIGGLVTSTVLTLIVVPVVYTLFDDFALWLSRRWAKANAMRADAAQGGVATLLLLGLLAAGPAVAQAPAHSAPAAPAVLTLDDAIRIAL